MYCHFYVLLVSVDKFCFFSRFQLVKVLKNRTVWEERSEKRKRLGGLWARVGVEEFCISYN